MRKIKKSQRYKPLCQNLIKKTHKYTLILELEKKAVIISRKEELFLNYLTTIPLRLVKISDSCALESMKDLFIRTISSIE